MEASIETFHLDLSIKNRTIMKAFQKPEKQFWESFLMKYFFFIAVVLVVSLEPILHFQKKIF